MIAPFGSSSGFSFRFSLRSFRFCSLLILVGISFCYSFRLENLGSRLDGFYVGQLIFPLMPWVQPPKSPIQITNQGFPQFIPKRRVDSHVSFNVDPMVHPGNHESTNSEGANRTLRCPWPVAILLPLPGGCSESKGAAL